MKKGWIANVLLLAGFLLAVFLFAGNRWLSVSEYELTLADLPEAFEGARIVHLSDLHNARFGTDQAALLAKVEQLQPDIVVMTGDLVSSGDTDLSDAMLLMEKLAERHETLFSMGNHEQIRVWMGVDGEGGLPARLTERGVFVLDNSHHDWVRNGQRIRFSGYTAELYEYADAAGKESAGVSESDPAPLFQVLGKPHQGIELLLAHNPEYLERYAAWGADAVFSGHMHGGVIRIPFVGGLLSPSREWFPIFDGGMYQHGETAMIVSRGLGNSVIPLRVLNPPEICLVTLNPD